MKIYINEFSDNKKANSSKLSDDVLSKFAELVETYLDDDVRKIKDKLSIKEKENRKLKESYDILKKEYSSKLSDLSKYKSIGRILNIVKRLNDQGKISGPTFNSIRNLLFTIENKKYSELIEIEEKLSAFVS